MVFTETILNDLKEYGAVLLDEPLSGFTTFKTGGPADCIITPHSKEAIGNIVSIVASNNIPLTVIGGGSNLLIGDNGIRGLVLRLSTDKSQVSEISVTEKGEIYGDASLSKEKFVDFALQNGYCGMEFMAGIPGCIGGGIVMNAGTNLGTFGEILSSVDIIDPSGESQNIIINEAMTSYRNLLLPKSSIVAGGYFSLKKSENVNETKDTIDCLLRERKEKHPLSYPSAGSVFKNPEGHSSWKLVDESGLKGYRIGGAMVSELHTNFIINAGDAKSIDIRNLIEHIQETIFIKKNIQMETEIRMIGEF